MSSKARRPYLMGSSSITQFYSASVRYLKEITSKESVFEKPYLEEDYRKMHLRLPEMGYSPLDVLPAEPSDQGVCAIVCYTSYDCTEPIWCHPGIWCGFDRECQNCRWRIEGDAWGYTPNHDVGFPWGIDVWIDGDAALENEGAYAYVSVTMIDPCGNECGTVVEVQCKDCPPDIEVSWDSDNSAETIDQSDTVSIYVKDGLSNYKWAVSGTGFTLAHQYTTGVTNSLISDGSACGTATITVTDGCGGVATGYVRCTTGTWAGKCSRSMPGGSCWPGTGDFVTVNDISGYLKYTFKVGCKYSAATCDLYDCDSYSAYIPDPALDGREGWCNEVDPLPPEYTDKWYACDAIGPIGCHYLKVCLCAVYEWECEE